MNRSSMPKQIMAFSNGGLASFIPRQTQIAGQPHMLAYINPQEEALLRDVGGSGIPGPGGIPSYPPDSAVAADYGATGLDGYGDDGGYWGGHPTDDDNKPGFNQAIADKAENEAISGSDSAVIGGFNESVYGGNIGSAIKGSFQNLAQDIKMGLSTFGMSKEKQAEALANAGYTQAQINSYQARTAQSMKEAAEAGKDYGGDDSSFSKLFDTDPIIGSGDNEDEDTGPPTSTNFRFYGGYQPRTRDDVLVASPGADEDFDASDDPRIAPIFAPDASLDSKLGVVPELTTKIATDVYGNPLAGQGQFATLQELMEYQQKYPTANLMGEYQRLKALEGGALEPLRLPQRGVASLMASQPATAAMYQGIMS